MHLPDGYLSPATCATLGAGMVPAWWAAGQRVRKVVKTRYVPLLALGSAYCFLVMMFNVPIPDGTTAHAVGGVLVAVLLGPWAAVVAVSTALLIQALFFGDGGVLAYGANCFNMALVMPVTGYATYKLVSRNTSLTSPRRALAAGIGGYVGINMAALCAAVELGLQPTLFHDAHGAPLYAPFHLAQTIPAMVGAHVLVAGAVELALTMGVVRYLQRANVPVLRINHADAPEGDDDPAPPRRLSWRWAWIGVTTMVVLTPLGLLAPGSAFGEDAPDRLRYLRSPILDGYGFGGEHPTIGYLVSAVVGAVIIVIALFVLPRLTQRRRDRDDAPIRA